ncbi:MAG: hypothetical protein ACU0BS_02255 [Hasllibacter sp.]
MIRTFLPAALLAALPLSAPADEVVEALEAAIEAYRAGDMRGVRIEMGFAEQALQAVAAAGFSQFLPEPLDGWTREVDVNGAAAEMAMMGGGAGADASYRNGGQWFGITMMADSPLLAMMMGVVANPAMTGGEMVRVGRERFVWMDGELVGVIGNRVLIQAEGDESVRDAMVAHLETIDFDALAAN